MDEQICRARERVAVYKGFVEKAEKALEGKGVRNRLMKRNLWKRTFRYYVRAERLLKALEYAYWTELETKEEEEGVHL